MVEGEKPSLEKNSNLVSVVGQAELDDTRGKIPLTSPNSACLRVLIMRPARAFRLRHAQKTLDLQHLQISWKLARENPT